MEITRPLKDEMWAIAKKVASLRKAVDHAHQVTSSVLQSLESRGSNSIGILLSLSALQPVASRLGRYNFLRGLAELATVASTALTADTLRLLRTKLTFSDTTSLAQIRFGFIDEENACTNFAAQLLESVGRECCGGLPVIAQNQFEESKVEPPKFARFWR